MELRHGLEQFLGPGEKELPKFTQSDSVSVGDELEEDRLFKAPWEKDEHSSEADSNFSIELESDLEIKETPEAVMEKAKERRTELFKNIFLSRLMKLVEAPLFLKICNNLPIFGDIQLARGALTGKEGSRKLPEVERFNYMIATVASVFAWVTAFSGDYAAAGVSGAVAYSVANFDALPLALQKSAQTIEGKMPRLAHMLETISDFISVNYEKMIVAEPYRVKGLKNSDV